ncbi:hypothetical protein QYE76_070104 [Lolium multiflorum]|uniref:Pectinesterase catalytic domain-containing protein n=1 Tax=Lolium multiflorum TaxID=4521 RepID=A0AAD8SIJ6_LOLMU|nr:hypothetical protein QYE76_070104 [Lolium multiflorum]
MTLVVRKPIKGQQNTVNSHGWKHATKTTGFMFQICNVVARDDLAHVDFPGGDLPREDAQGARPCGVHGVRSSELGRPQGMVAVAGQDDVVDMYFGEYRNSGTIADVNGLVNWSGFHVITHPFEATNSTILVML